MKARVLLLLIAALALSGCTVRTYKLTKDRIDQDLTTGNRGYLEGRAPAVDTSAKKTTRDTQVVEVEFRPLIKFEKGPKVTSEAKAESAIEEQAPVSEEVMGNRGYVTQSESAEIAEAPAMEKYKVQKDDTLQKISNKFYGTTKKWNKIYDANKDSLKGPNKLYPGQVINIPVIKQKAAKVPEGLK